MLILLSPLLLVSTAAVLVVLSVVRVRFRFGWLLGLAGATASFLSIFLWLPLLPLSAEIPLWQSSASSNSFATFTLSSTSSPYLIGFAALAVAMMLMAPTWAEYPSPSKWVLCLGAAALGMLAASAQSALTLVLLWAALDLAEAGVVLARSADRSANVKLPASFSMRLSAIGLVLLGLVLGQTGPSTEAFGDIQGAGAWLFPLAALIRLLAFAAPGTDEHAVGPRDEVGMMLELAAGAAAVAFLAQLTPQNEPGGLLMHIACAAAALYASWMWLRAPDPSSGRPYWIMTTGALAVAASLRGNPLGSSAWGAFMLLGGAALFLRGIGERLVQRALLAILWIGSALPLSLTAVVWIGGGGLQDVFLAGYLAAQAMLISGTWHAVFHPIGDVGKSAASVSLRTVHRIGIFLVIAVAILLGVWGWQGALQIGSPAAGAVAVATAVAVAWAKRRAKFLSPVPDQWTPIAPRRALRRIRAASSKFREPLQRVAQGITGTMEGEAGILWSLVLLVLFISLIVDGGH